MAIQGEQEAIQFTVPRAVGSGELGAPQRVTFSGTASGPTQIVGTGINWYTFVANEDCHIRFGTNAGMGLATSSDWPLFKGQEYSRFINVAIDGWFSVIQETNAGAFWIGPSNR